MEVYAKEKIYHAIDACKQFDADKHPELFNGYLFSRYQLRQNDFPRLNLFLTAAQLQLANCLLPLNKAISGESKIESLLNNLTDTLGALSAFDKTIMTEADYEVVLGDNFPRAQIEHAIQSLRYRPSHWEEPRSQDRFREPPLKRHPMFSVEPVDNTGFVANSPKILSDVVDPLVQHSRLSNGAYRSQPNEGQDPQEHQQSTTQAEQAGRKHYTVFVSSTFEDMRDIRAAVLGRLYSTEDFMPIGMENFMASDSSQLDYIRERLNDTDIYVLLLGGRYGTLTPRADRSYTHEEYEMAKANPDVRVLSFVCDHPENLPAERRWRNDDEHDRLMEFTKEVESDKMVRPWAVDADPEKITGDVYQSLVDETKKGTMRGWTRGEWPEPEQ